MSDDEDYEIIEDEPTKLTVITSDTLEKHKHGDKELEKEITLIVNEAIQADIRISDTPETREALRDYIRMEIILAMKFQDAVKHPGSITTADERMIRSAVKMKMDIRNELFKDVKGKPGKEIEVGLVREQVQKRIVKAQRTVDILE